MGFKTIEPYCDTPANDANFNRVKGIMAQDDSPAKQALITSMETAAGTNPLSPENGGGRIGYDPSEFGNTDPNNVFSATGSTHRTEQDSNCVSPWSPIVDLSQYYDGTGPGGGGPDPNSISPNAPNIYDMCDTGKTWQDQYQKLEDLPRTWDQGSQPGWWGEWQSNDADTWQDPDEWEAHLETICETCENYGNCEEFESRIGTALADADNAENE